MHCHVLAWIYPNPQRNRTHFWTVNLSLGPNSNFSNQHPKHISNQNPKHNPPTHFFEAGRTYLFIAHPTHISNTTPIHKLSKHKTQLDSWSKLHSFCISILWGYIASVDHLLLPVMPIFGPRNFAVVFVGCCIVITLLMRWHLTS